MHENKSCFIEDGNLTYDKASLFLSDIFDRSFASRAGNAFQLNHTLTITEHVQGSADGKSAPFLISIVEDLIRLR
jgi:hypothetical protein